MADNDDDNEHSGMKTITEKEKDTETSAHRVERSELESYTQE